MTKMSGDGARRLLAVVGAGRMGSQIAVEFASSGFRTYVLTRDESTARHRLADAISLLELKVGEDKGSRSDVNERIVLVSDATELPSEIELALESVPEDLVLKRTVLSQIAEQLPHAVLASNTSSFTITDLVPSSEIATRTVGMHYWYPPILMDLVELVPAKSEPWAIERARALISEIGKRSVLVNRDIPGFVWNRLQFALLREAYALVRSGVATREDVDLVIRDGLARRLVFTGPFETAAAGGASAFESIGRRIIPSLSSASDIDGLEVMVSELSASADEIVRRRDAGLIAWAAPK